MTADLLTFRPPAVVSPPPVRIDPGYSTLSLLTRLREALTASARIVAECRKRQDRRRWGEPAVFFFRHPARPSPVGPSFPEPYLGQLAPRMPAAAKAWDALPDLLDDALTLLPMSVEVRRMARTVFGLRERADELADLLPAAKMLAGLLAVPDDQVVLAIHPATRTGVRVGIRGVADVNQLHVLLADTLPGLRPDPRVVDACRSARPDADAAIFTPRWQLFHPAALRSDGTLPRGFDSSDLWAWGHQSPADLPLDKGERVVLLGEPAYRAGWEVARKFPQLNGEWDVLERLSTPAVTEWLAKRCPQLPKLRERLAA